MGVCRISSCNVIQNSLMQTRNCYKQCDVIFHIKLCDTL